VVSAIWSSSLWCDRGHRAAGFEAQRSLVATSDDPAASDQKRSAMTDDVRRAWAGHQWRRPGSTASADETADRADVKREGNSGPPSTSQARVLSASCQPGREADKPCARSRIDAGHPAFLAWGPRSTPATLTTADGSCCELTGNMLMVLTHLGFSGFVVDGTQTKPTNSIDMVPFMPEYR
jgi:hypothetical protein